jgi:hypothetical protein
MVEVAGLAASAGSDGHAVPTLGSWVSTAADDVRHGERAAGRYQRRSTGAMHDRLKTGRAK